MTDASFTLELTVREVAPLLKYGLPFAAAAEHLPSSKVKTGTHVMHVDPHWISTRTADIVRSAEKIISQSLVGALDALCDVLKNAENHDSRMREFSLASAAERRGHA